MPLSLTTTRIVCQLPPLNHGTSQRLPLILYEFRSSSIMEMALVALEGADVAGVDLDSSSASDEVDDPASLCRRAALSLELVKRVGGTTLRKGFRIETGIVAK